MIEYRGVKIQKGDILLDSMEYVIFDIETTGLEPSASELTEIGAIIVKDGEVLDKFNTLVSIEGKVPEEIVELTGITDEMLRGQPSLGEALNSFKAFVGGRPLVAHNIRFDVGYLDSKHLELGRPYSETFYNNHVCIDTLSMAQFLVKNTGSHRLDVLADYFNIENKDHHRAVNDCEVLHGILEMLLKVLRIRVTKGEVTEGDLKFIYNKNGDNLEAELLGLYEGYGLR